jgi:Rrf2 family protein
MLISQTSRYALQAAVYLAGTWGEARLVPVGQIAEALDVPRNYLSKTLHQLARSGVLVSVRGPGGGFRLAEDPAKVTLGEIVLPVEPGIADRPCLLGRATCSEDDPCPAHDRWRALADQSRQFLDETYLADLVRRD